MEFVRTAIPDVVLVRPKVFGDARGFFLESWEERKFAAAGLDMHFVQDNHSRSARGVLRGLHYQLSQPQGKLVRVITGKVFDDVVYPVIKNAKEIAIPGKPIIIGEIGWPSSGRTRSEAVPTLVNEARFMRTLAANADALGVGYNLIEAIDQPWKRIPEGTVGAYWGLLDNNRELKFPLTGPVSEWAAWRTGAASSRRRRAWS